MIEVRRGKYGTIWSSLTLCISLQHCELEPLVGECGLVEGVGGPGTDFGMNHFGDPDCI